MSTRGAFGFRCDGKDYVSYCHFDAYPDGLGVKVFADVATLLAELAYRFRTDPKEPRMNLIKERVRSIRLVESEKAPTPEDEKAFSHLRSFGVGGDSLTYYQLLHQLQGSLVRCFDSGIMVEYSAFLKESLWCEYAYIMNLDSESLELYKGFNSKPGGRGRYALEKSPDKEYFGVKLVGEIAFKDFGDTKEQDFLQFYKKEGETDNA